MSFVRARFSHAWDGRDGEEADAEEVGECFRSAGQPQFSPQRPGEAGNEDTFDCDDLDDSAPAEKKPRKGEFLP